MNVGRFQGNLPERTFEYAVSVLDLVKRIPDGTIGWVVGKQLARSGTSIGANICEADHAFTDADFAYRCSIARKESSETHYWIRLGRRCDLVGVEESDHALNEAEELTRILTTIVKKLQQKDAAS